MRNLFRTLLALVYLASATLAQAGYIVNSARYTVAGGGSASLTFLTSIIWSSGGTISASVDIGSADANKEIFVSYASNGGATRSFSSGTVAGVSLVPTASESTTSTKALGVAFVSLPSQAGSQTVSVTFTGTLTAGQLCVYKVLNRSGIGTGETDHSQASSASTTSNSVSGTTIPANGMWLGHHIRSGAVGTTSPTVENADQDAGNATGACSSRDFDPVGGTPTTAWSWSGNAPAIASTWAFQ